MTDEELVKRLRWKAGAYAKEAADRIEALTEQLEAARADAKEAEAYAEELERDLNICRMAQVVMENGIAEAEKERDAHKGNADTNYSKWVEADAKLAKAVELLKEARQDLEAYVTHDWPKDVHPHYDKKWERDMELCRRIDATLAEIGGGKDE